MFMVCAVFSSSKEVVGRAIFKKWTKDMGHTTTLLEVSMIIYYVTSKYRNTRINIYIVILIRKNKYN